MSDNFTSPPSSVIPESTQHVTPKSSHDHHSGGTGTEAPAPSHTDVPVQTQPAPPRKIDENTDINTLTDEEIRQLNEQAVSNAMEVQDERVRETSRYYTYLC
jgi:hypothetical protein